MKISSFYHLLLFLLLSSFMNINAENILIDTVGKTQKNPDKGDIAEFQKIIDEGSINIEKEIENLRIDKLSKDLKIPNAKSPIDIFDSYSGDSKPKTPKNNDCCTKNAGVEEGVDLNAPVLKVFMTFKLHDNIWKSLDREMIHIGGRFVVRGIPGNDFKSLIQKISHLREIGILSPIDLNPVDFDKYGIEVAPSFVVHKSDILDLIGSSDEEDGKPEEKNRKIPEDLFDLISGNVQVSYALKMLAESGDLEESRDLYRSLTDIKVNGGKK